MKVLITGANGMLGRTLCRRLARNHVVVPLTRADADLTDCAAVQRVVRQQRPEVIIHGAAMTAVDACETERDRAFAANSDAARHVADAARDVGARMVQISTDYVFAGDLDRPYQENDATGPRTVYGQSKLAGEQAVIAAGGRHTIVRVAWLYGSGGPSFVHTMRKLGAQTGPTVSVVDDQRGNPTSTDAVADLLNHLIQHPIDGVVHGTCEGDCTWFGFAQAILAHAGAQRAVQPCTTAQFPRPAPRPANSCLDKRALRQAGGGFTMPTWQAAFERFCRDYPQG
jgi:dTDP-4-dehydrorhamnose reductase